MDESEEAYLEWWRKNKRSYDRYLTGFAPEDAWNAGREWERKKCWDAINQMIEPGDLDGDGWDKTAERNGLINAANAIMERFKPAKPLGMP